jgi:anti-sigma B factor antagonist
MTAFKHFEIELCDDITVICLLDPKFFDTERYAELRHELIDFVEQQHPKSLLVDFSRVEYCSTALINALMTIKERVESEGGRMMISGMNEPARETFERLKLDGRVFTIYPTRADAIEAF